MNIKALILTIGSMVIIGCNGSSGSDSDDKDLFSLWHVEGTDTPLDLRDGSFDEPMYLSFFFEGGEQCDCDFTVIGDQSSGTYIVNSCFYEFGSGSADPGCNALNETGTYTNSNSTLTASSSNGTTVYE